MHLQASLTKAERSVLCAALQVGPAEACRAALDQTDVQWERLVERARPSMMLPALGRAIRGRSAAKLPSGLRATLEEAPVHNELQNRLLLHDVAHVVSLLRRTGIESIPVKGAALLARLPQYARVRHTDDIDLWIAPGREEDAACVLREAGFLPLANAAMHEHHPGIRYDGTLSPHGPSEHQLPTLVSPRGTPVELHRYLPGRRTATWDEALRACERVALNGVEVYARDAVSTLIDLCSHVIFHHMSAPVLWPRHVMDVAALTAAVPGVFLDALARGGRGDRAALLFTRTVLAEMRRSVGGELLARRLVFPTGAHIGWGWYRAGHRLVWGLRYDRSNMARAAWPSRAFLEARGFAVDGSEWRARLRHYRWVLGRLGASG